MTIVVKMLHYPILFFAITIVLVHSFQYEKYRIEEEMSIEEALFYFGNDNPSESDYEIISMPDWKNNEIQFTAFDKDFNLSLTRNLKLVAPEYICSILEEDRSYTMPLSNNLDCHYLHISSGTIGAFSFCGQYHMKGSIFTVDYIYEVISLNERLHGILKRDGDEHVLNIVKRIPNLDYELSLFDDDTHVILKDKEKELYRNSEPIEYQKESNISSHHSGLTLEMAIFFDEKAYKSFAPYFDYDLSKIQDMILAYMNMVQALYYEPSLGLPLTIVIIKLDIFKTQPEDLPHYYGERSLLLDSFCSYNYKYNRDGNKQSWDIGIYLSSLDFYATEKGVTSYGTMGLATVGGVCTGKYSCLISEFGTTNEYGKPYPSAGFSSAYILAHEIGHNLGMHHDGTSNNCPSNGYIMSPSRGIYGETLWSPCSASVMSTLSKTASCLNEDGKKKSQLEGKLDKKPGLFWNSKKQCEILLKDKEAYMMNTTQNICENIQCQSPQKTGFYHAGPALDGTKCGPNKWCINGNCVDGDASETSNKIVKGHWTDWKTLPCESKCIMKSKGYQKKTRACNGKQTQTTNLGCDGASVEIQLCKDDKLCKKNKRITTVEYATTECQKFSRILPTLEKSSTGIQAPFEPERPWTPCAIFCKRKDSDTFYSPRLDLNDLDFEPYFPDGTLCHNDGKINYYCLHHQCVPEGSRGSRNMKYDDLLIPQNANYNVKNIPEELRKYLSMDSNGAPLLTTLTPDISDEFNSNWFIEDEI